LRTHIGSFFGNAIADWSGVVVMVFATKYLYEKGSAESRRPPQKLLGPVLERLRNHSLSIFLLITGVGWVAFYASVDSEAKWGQVVGNIVSEWTQVFGLVLLTKRLIERHSKESAR
jgi:prolipoprotein diacylglyceryltransferase